MTRPWKSLLLYGGFLIVFLTVCGIWIALGVPVSKGAGEFAQKVQDICVLFGHESTPIVQDLFYPNGNLGSLGPVTEVRTRDLWFQFDSKTHDLLRFAYKNREEVPAGLTKEDGIPEQQARDIGTKVFDRLVTGYKVSNQATFSIVSADYARGNNPARDDLDDAEWTVAGSYYYAGIPVWSSIFVKVSAYSGKVTHFFAFPYVPPEPSEDRISEKRAIELATASVGGRYTLSLKSAQKCYVFPAKYWKSFWLRRPVMKKAPRLAWRIDFMGEAKPHSPENSRFAIPIFVQVDAETGRIIGGTATD